MPIAIQEPIMNKAKRNIMKSIPAVLLICVVMIFYSGCKKPSGDGGQNITTIQYEASTEIFPNPERGFGGCKS